MKKADLVDERFEKSKELTEEFNSLRAELEAITRSLTKKKHHNEDKVKRKAEVQARMHQITIEMARALDEARKATRPDVQTIACDDLDDENFEGPADLEDVQLARPGSTIRRVSFKGRQYDSTSSEEEHEDGEEEEAEPDGEQLRERMREEARRKDPNVQCNVITVSEADRWAGMKGWLSGRRKPADEREEIKAEMERLDRELKRRGGNVKSEEERMEQITSRLQELGDKMLNIGDPPLDQSTVEKRKDSGKSSAAPPSLRASLMSPRAKTFFKSLKTPRSSASSATVNSFDSSFAPMQDEDNGPHSSTTVKSLRERAKSRLGNFGGVGSRTFLLRKKNTDNTSPVTPSGGGIFNRWSGSSQEKSITAPSDRRTFGSQEHKQRSVGSKSDSDNAGDQPSDLLRNRAVERGEKLTNLGDQIQGMADGAKDLAEMARKLRAKQN